MDVPKLRRLCRFGIFVSVFGVAAALAGVLLNRSATYFLGQVAGSFVGAVAGFIIADVALGGLAGAPRRSVLTLVALAGSQIGFYLLVWTDFKIARYAVGWRCWWIPTVVAVTGAHLLGLRGLTHRREKLVEQLTPIGAALSGAMLVTLGLRPEAPPSLDLTFLGAFAPPALLSALGTWMLWKRKKRQGDLVRPMPRWAQVTWIVGAGVAVFMGGYYVGGAGGASAGAQDLFPAALAGLRPEEIEAQLRSDLPRLKTAISGLEELAARTADLEAQIEAKQKAEGREFYTPEEDGRIRWAFVTYLSHRATLLRLVATYGRSEVVSEPGMRARCFMTGYAAASAAYEYAIRFVRTYRDRPIARRKINEAEPVWGIPDGMFERIYQSVTREQNLGVFHEMGAYYRLQRDSWRSQAVWPPDDFAWIDSRIQRSLDYVERNALSPTRAWISDLVVRMKRDVYEPIYSAQSLVSEWIGDTKIVKYPPLISIAQIRELQTRLKPGDILLERRNFYLSNAFLPGFWPHGALYIGKPDELRRLGIADRPELRKVWERYRRPAHDGEPHTVLESISEGVVFNSLTESMHADYVAVLRPRLKDAEIAEAIVRAFSHEGKPYDFEFDFFTSDKLVCTELVYRAYQGMIQFDLVRVAGRDTLPALEIARKYAAERGTPKQQLDLVLYLEGFRRDKVARFSDEPSFIQSIDRPGVFDE
jgi:hypothetical protein